MHLRIYNYFFSNFLIECPFSYDQSHYNIFACLFRDWISSHGLCSCRYPQRLKKQQYSSRQAHESQGLRFWSFKTCCWWSFPCFKYSSRNSRISGSWVRPLSNFSEFMCLSKQCFCALILVGWLSSNRLCLSNLKFVLEIFSWQVLYFPAADRQEWCL